MVSARTGAAVLAAATLTIVLWGATPVATKAAVASIDPVLVGILRTVLAGAAAIPVILFLGIRPPSGRRAMSMLALSAVCGFIGFPILFSLGQRFTSAAHGALILATLPLFTGIFAAILDRRPPGRRWWIGCAIAIGGEALLIGSSSGFDGDGSGLFGDAVILASALLASLGYVTGAHLSRSGYGTWGTTFWGVVVASGVLLPAIPLAWDWSAWTGAGVVGWGAVAYLAIGSTILAYVAWYWALGAGGIARIGLFQFFQPMVGVVLAAVLLSEPVTVPLLLSAGVILSGVFIARRT